VQQILKGAGEDWKWDSLFVLLSTERVGPFLGDIGLVLPKIKVVRDCARLYIEERHRTAAQAEPTDVLVRRAFERITQQADPETAQRLYDWAEGQFHNHDKYYYASFQWLRLLWRLAGITRANAVPLNLPPAKVEQIKQAVKENYGQEYWELRNQIKQVDQKPMSDWDVYLYKLYRDGVSEETSPLDILDGALSRYRFAKVWEAVTALLTQEQLQILLEWGRAQSVQSGLPPPEKLP
jgi:hypothetical protein